MGYSTNVRSAFPLGFPCLHTAVLHTVLSTCVMCFYSGFLDLANVFLFVRNFLQGSSDAHLSKHAQQPREPCAAGVFTQRCQTHL